MGAFDDVLSALGAKSSPVPANSSVWQIPPAVQAQRDKERLGILQQELATETNPANRAALQREIVRAGGSAQVTEPQASSQWDSVIGALNSPIPAAQAKQAKSNLSAVADAIDIAKDTRSNLRGLVANQLTGIGANIIGGWRGLATLATGGGFDNAANATNEEISNRTFQGSTDQQQRTIANFNSPINPLTWPSHIGQKAGEISQDLGASPSVAAGINTAATFLSPVAAGKLLRVTGNAIKSRVPGESVANAPEQAQPKPTPENQARQVPEQQGASQPKQTKPAVENENPLVLSQEEQLNRAKILNEIGIQEARRSAVSGDPKAAATDYQMTKIDSPAGNMMRAKFAEERQAIENYSDKIVHETGGTVGTDQSALYGRGNAIVAPLDSLKQWFDSRISNLYQAANERSQGVPTTLERFKQVLADDSEMTNSDRVHLRDAATAYAKKLGIVDENGNFTGNAQQAETMRKYLGESWSPQNGRFVGKLKDAIDEDVMSSAGEDIYSEARKMRSLRGSTLDDPNGIAKIMDSSGPEGMNRAVSVEKIPDAITGMSVDQFKHVVRTLKNVPEELQPQADAAISEIKAQFANKVADAGRSTKGQWNVKAVQNYLKNNAERMSQVFTPEEMQKFQTLHQAGQILMTDQSYPGAAVQQHNLLRSGAMAAVKGGATTLGATVGGPVGAYAGSVLGEKAANAMSDAAAVKATKKRMVPLKELLDTGQ